LDELCELVTEVFAKLKRRSSMGSGIHVCKATSVGEASEAMGISRRTRGSVRGYPQECWGL